MPETRIYLARMPVLTCLACGITHTIRHVQDILLPNSTTASRHCLFAYDVCSSMRTEQQENDPHPYCIQQVQHSPQHANTPSRPQHEMKSE